MFPYKLRFFLKLKAVIEKKLTGVLTFLGDNLIETKIGRKETNILSVRKKTAFLRNLNFLKLKSPRNYMLES